MSEGVVLVGLPGTGKSTVGRCVAESLGRPFVDIDASISDATGRTAGEHIERDGEDAFRRVEREAIARAVQEPGAVIATGGGSVLDPLNRWDLAAHGSVVWLDAPAALLVERLRSDDVARPLLRADPHDSLARLGADRAPYYRAADVRVDASAAPRDVAGAIVSGLGTLDRRRTWRPLFDAEVPRHHPIGPPLQRVTLGRGIDGGAVSGSLAELADGRRAAVLVDAALPGTLPLLRDVLPAARVLAVAGGERAKRMRRLEAVLEWLAREGVERGDPLVAVGGGTVGDLAGVAAALYMRGIPLVHVPTTWLAQADSAIGGKAAVDLSSAKNAAGAYWPAWAVLSDVTLLRSLPVARLRDGMAESIKAGLIGDPGLWQLIESRGAGALHGTDEAARYAITERAVRVKLAVVERDPFERGERRHLNLGHTLGHALEVVSRYRLPHGAAVALGLRAVMDIAERRGCVGSDLPERLDAMLEMLGFRLRVRFDPSAVRAAIGGDKKRERGRQRWILPAGIGRVVEVDDVSDAELESAMARVRLS